MRRRGVRGAKLDHERSTRRFRQQWEGRMEGMSQEEVNAFLRNMHMQSPALKNTMTLQDMMTSNQEGTANMMNEFARRQLSIENRQRVITDTLNKTTRALQNKIPSNGRQ